MAELRGVPGGGQLWKAGSRWFVVYFVPGAEPPVPLAWSVSDDELANIAPGTPTADRTFRSLAEAGREGLLTLGQSEQLLNTTDNPFRTFVSDYERQARALPMLQDPEVLALFAAGQLEGRQPTVEELRMTDWWQSRTAGEREWATIALQDPKSAQQMLEDRKIAVRNAMRSGGIDITSELVDHLANKWTTGQWTETKVQEQLAGLADPYTGISLDPRVAEIARSYDPSGRDRQALEGGEESVRNRIRAMFNNRDVDLATHLQPNVTEDPDARLERLTQEVLSGETTLDSIRQSVRRLAGLHPLTDLDVDRQGEERVRQLLIDWLGPQLAQQYEGGWLRKWAGELRNSPDGEERLLSTLRQVRMANFPEWQNENLRYADVAPTTKSLFQQVWQQEPDETDPLFLDILRMAAPGGPGLTEAAARLRREGLERGVSGVTQQMSSGILGATGGDVRRAV